MSHSCILIRHHITVFAFEIGAGPQPSTQVEYDDDQTKQKSLVAFLCRFDGLPSCAGGRYTKGRLTVTLA